MNLLNTCLLKLPTKPPTLRLSGGKGGSISETLRLSSKLRQTTQKNFPWGISTREIPEGNIHGNMRGSKFEMELGRERARLKKGGA